jgi:CPA1 family monovalent cation:H+ antiporter
MDHADIFISFGVVAAVAFVGALAKRLDISAAIAFVVAGALIGFIPFVPVIHIKPDVALMILMPPLLYSAGVGMSWRGMRDNLWTITFLAVGGVIFTAVGIAAILNLVFGIDWLLGLLLGAIIAPPDAVAPMAIVKRFVVPSRLSTIIEGEGLVNDATALILVGFTVAALQGADFSVVSASGRFLLIVVGEIVWGMAIGRLVLQLRHWAGDPHVEILLSLLTPYIAFWIPEAVGGSGVLAAVVAGLFVSWNGPRFISPATRLQGFFAWDLVVYVIEGVAFFLTGLQARVIFETAKSDVWSGYLLIFLVVAVATVGLRFVWVFAGTYFPRLIGWKLGVCTAVQWRNALVISVIGVRGVVSLLAALSLPALSDANDADSRSMILVVTIGVILVSMLGVNFTLPGIVKKLGLSREGSKELAANKAREIKARKAGVEAVLKSLEEIERKAEPGEPLQEVKRRQADRLRIFGRAEQRRAEGTVTTDDMEVQIRLIDVERKEIARLYAEDHLDDDARRRIERELDLEDTRLRHAWKSAT